MPRDPYESPDDGHIELPDAAPTESLGSIARRVFLAWEWLRIAYNLCLVVVTLGAAGLHDVAMLWTPLLWIVAVPGAVVANIA